MELHAKLDLLRDIYPDQKLDIVIEHAGKAFIISNYQCPYNDGLEEDGWRLAETSNNILHKFNHTSIILSHLEMRGIPTRVIEQRIDYTIQYSTVWIAESMEKITKLLGKEFIDTCKKRNKSLADLIKDKLNDIFLGISSPNETIEEISEIMTTGKEPEQKGLRLITEEKKDD